MIEQDNEDDNDWYTWGSATANEQESEPFEHVDEDMIHNVTSTDKTSSSLKTTGEEEDDIQTKVWENTYQPPSMIEGMDTKQQAMFSPSSHMYNQSTALDGGIQVIHLMGRAIFEAKEWMKAWDHKAFLFDPLSFRKDTWEEGDYQHPYSFGDAKTITVTSNKEYMLDSGATCHMTSSGEFLEDYRIERTRVVVGENSSCETQTSGTLHLKFSTHDKGIDTLTLKRVFMASVFSKKVISILLLIAEGYSFVFKGDYCLILAPNHKFI